MSEVPCLIDEEGPGGHMTMKLWPPGLREKIKEYAEDTHQSVLDCVFKALDKAYGGMPTE